MSLEEFKQIDAKALPIGKLISIIAKNQTIFLNRHLDNLDINATQLHLLFEISHQSDINQEKIAKRCCINKGAVARSIKKLEEKELIIRKIDDSNRRQNKISLTTKGEKTLKESIDLLHQWEKEIYNETVIEKELLQKVLKQMAVKTIEINLKGE